jgi:hypothetical protein
VGAWVSADRRGGVPHSWWVVGVWGWCGPRKVGNWKRFCWKLSPVALTLLAVSGSLPTMAGQVNKRMLYVGGIADEVDVQVRPRPRTLLACDSDTKLGTTQSFVCL